MTPDPIIPLSALEHHLYCPRQCALIHVDGIWRENRATVAGSRAHRRVDTPGGRWERSRRVLRAIPLYSDRFGLIGRADGVELYEDGSIAPVEHKSGVRHGQAADVQLCAQALCLEEMFGKPVPCGYVWYGAKRRREAVSLDEALRSLTVSVVDAVRRNIADGTLPPAVADERCRECQLEPVCMPHVVIRPKAVERYVEEDVFTCQ